MDVQTRVDQLLKENALIWANLGTGTAHDLKTYEAANKKWQEILAEIKTLDKTTYEMVSGQTLDDEDMAEDTGFLNMDRLAKAESKLESGEIVCNMEDPESCENCGS